MTGQEFKNAMAQMDPKTVARIEKMMAEGKFERAMQTLIKNLK